MYSKEFRKSCLYLKTCIGALTGSGTDDTLLIRLICLYFRTAHQLFATSVTLNLISLMILAEWMVTAILSGVTA